MSELDIAKLHAEGRKFRTKKGKPVRILCTDRKVNHTDIHGGIHTVIGLIEGGNTGIEFTCAWDNNGRSACTRVNDGQEDLELVKEKRTAYIQVDPNDEVVGGLFFIKARAENNKRNAGSSEDRILKITWEE